MPDRLFLEWAGIRHRCHLLHLVRGVLRSRQPCRRDQRNDRVSNRPYRSRFSIKNVIAKPARQHIIQRIAGQRVVEFGADQAFNGRERIAVGIAMKRMERLNDPETPASWTSTPAPSGAQFEFTFAAIAQNLDASQIGGSRVSSGRAGTVFGFQRFSRVRQPKRSRFESSSHPSSRGSLANCCRLAPVLWRRSARGRLRPILCARPRAQPR
jgi:hypothetical protein